MAIGTFVDDQNAILEYLRDSDIPYVFENSVPMGADLPKDYNNLLPYCLLSFGGRTPIAGSNQNLGSTRDDLRWTTVAVECIAENPLDTRVIASIVRDKLEGYNPGPDWGELSEILSGDYTIKRPDSDLTPIRHSTIIAFHTLVNAVS